MEGDVDHGGIYALFMVTRQSIIDNYMVKGLKFVVCSILRRKKQNKMINVLNVARALKPRDNYSKTSFILLFSIVYRMLFLALHFLRKKARNIVNDLMKKY